MEPRQLSRLPLLNALSSPGLEALTDQVTPRGYLAGEYVFHEGDPPGDLYILQKGIVEAVVRADEEELVLSPLEAPTVFGGMSFIEDVPRSSGIRASTDIEVVVVPRDVIETLRDVDPLGLSDVFRRLFVTTSDRLRVANSVISHYFKSLLEKRQRDRAEEELRHLLVHDIRSPLALCATGLSQLLDRRNKYGELTAKQERVLKRSRRSANFLRRLVEEILEVGRSESGQERLEEISVREILREALVESIGGISEVSLDSASDLDDFETVRAALAEQDVHVEASRETLSTTLCVDRYRVLQVIMNLVGNALKHAPGWLAIRVAAEPDRVNFAVVDRGPGIPPELRERIFDLHRQAEVKNAGVHRGFGLGLAGAARLVTALGGEIRAEAGDDGEGTQMVFHIPRRMD